MEPQNPNPGSNSDYRTINEFISDSQLMLNNTLADTQIADRMAAAGYTMAVITAKLAEVDQLRNLNESQALEYGEQNQATDNLVAAKDGYHETYIEHLELARIAFRKNTEARVTLELDERRKRTYGDYIGQGLLFYNNAARVGKPYAAALAGKGIDSAALAAGAAHFKALQDKLEVQQKETGEAQQATATRNALYDELEDWMSEYRATAKVVLRKFPQLMEELGIKDPSPGGATDQ